MPSREGRTAWKANQVLGRRGAFWQDENYDHVVRDEAELCWIIGYVLDSSVRAGLTPMRDDGEWSYCRYEL